MEVPTIFRELTPDKIQKFKCDGDIQQTFHILYNIKVEKLFVASEDRYIDIPDTYPTPVGILYRRDGKTYAMGVSNTTGRINTDTFSMTVKRWR